MSPLKIRILLACAIGLVFYLVSSSAFFGAGWFAGSYWGSRNVKIEVNGSLLPKSNPADIEAMKKRNEALIVALDELAEAEKSGNRQRIDAARKKADEAGKLPSAPRKF